MNIERALLSAAAVAGLIIAAGCSKHQTEMILVIMTEGVRVPDDVHKLHLKVADREGSIDDTIYESDVELCNPQLTSACYDIPVTAVLFPGKSHGTDSVRVQVDAIGGGGVVIADAALFTFADEQSLRLDFVLYANCLGNVACAQRDQACGPLDTCIDLKPGTTNGTLDLALPVVADMSIPPGPPDMTMVDLAGADLTMVPPDLVSLPIDMAGCSGVMCDMDAQCVAGQCQGCGLLGYPCCFGPTAPPPNHSPAGGTSGTCDQTNLECNGTDCVRCGGPGELCCVHQAPSCNGAYACIMGTCQLAPMDMTMLPGDMMSAGGDLL